MDSSLTGKDIGKRLREARESLKMSQRQLSDQTKISVTQISSYETGKKQIGLVSLANLCSCLGRSLDEIYYGSPSKTPISTAKNDGELIVNCIDALFSEGVIRKITQDQFNDFGQNTEKVEFVDYLNVISSLVDKLTQFERESADYPDPDSFKKQLLAAAAKQINDAKKNREDEAEDPEDDQR